MLLASCSLIEQRACRYSPSDEMMRMQLIMALNEVDFVRQSSISEKLIGALNVGHGRDSRCIAPVLQRPVLTPVARVFHISDNVWSSHGV